MCTNLHKTAIATTYMRKKEEEKKNSAECLTAGLKGRGVQEGWTSYKNERNLEGKRADHSCVLKDEVAGKKTSLAELRVSSGTQEEKLNLWPLG